MKFNWLNFPEELLSAVGFALLHSLWQAALVALVLFVLMRFLQNAAAGSRYLLAFIGMATMTILPIITFFRIYQPVITSSSAIEEVDNGSLASVMYVLAESQFGIDALMHKAEAFIALMAPQVFWFWVIGMLLMAIRMSGGYFVAYRLKHFAIFPVDKEWQLRLEQLAAQLQIKRKIRFLESTRVDVPLVIGFLKPAIIVPLGTLSRLPFDQIEMILAHELAHIRRADFLVNMLQAVVEVILFFNPFVWWISSVIRAERENLCDDIALQTTGKHLSLAKALVNLSTDQTQNISLNSVVYFNKFNTMKRIERLFNNPRLKPSPAEKMSVIVLSLIFVLFISTTGILTGSNSMSDDFETAPAFVPMGVMPSDFHADTLLNGKAKKEQKEIEVEVVNGKAVKMIVDGVEVPAEELQKEDFVWTDKDTTVLKKVIVRRPDKKHKTVIVETDEVEWHQKNDKASTKKIIVREGMPNKMMRITATEGNSNDSIEVSAEYILFDGDSLKTSSGRKMQMHRMPQEEFAVFDDPEMEFFFDAEEMQFGDGEEFEAQKKYLFVQKEQMMREREERKSRMHKQADEMARQAEQLNREAERIEQNNKEAAMRLKMEAENLVNEASRLREEALIPVPPVPEIMKMDRDVKRINPAIRHLKWESESTSIENQQQQLFRQEMIRDGVASKRSNVIISKKQLIVDEQVMDKKIHRKFLNRYEEITGRKLEAGEAVSLRR
ncbi:MAG: hypothetical protein CVT92_13910 [Bacteroidetes bacterium HGW-Bacteroidetes-1]|jgi:beta-lactamase regulating signal transducer with metallopeptidase domain|nr:MAG: hypothetical protein CVT92_13910 [Bacteroidetes bacterium HGW-Bacteroidetes-1]